MNIDFRTADIKDLDDVCLLIKQAIENMYRHNIHQWDSEYPNRKILREDLEKEQLYIGTVGGKTAVIYVLNQEYDEEYKNGQWRFPQKSFCIIHRLCVTPALQNQGIAKETIKHIEECAVSSGINAIRLDCFIKNPYALKLYKNSGYNTVGYADWRMGRFCLMEKYLY